jgi:hypothetical protein
MTIEDVVGRLKYIGESEDARRIIASAISQLPDDVQEFALDGGFLSVGDPAAGFYVSRENLRYLAEGVPWLVILSDVVDYEDMESLVAHEIAHLWLGHDTGAVGLEAFAAAEEAAAALVKTWGFVGMGTRPSSEDLTRTIGDE